MRIRNLLFCLTTLLLPLHSGAAVLPVDPPSAVLSFDPPSASGDINDIFVIDINIADFGYGTADPLAGFGFDILYDSSILGFESVSFGSLLGDLDPLSFETDLDTTLNPGILNLFELSWLSDTELEALQSDSFTLATVTFKGLAAGNSSLTLDNIDLTDALGSSLASTSSSANITVNSQPPIAVDEPSVLILMLSSLALMIYSRRRRAIPFNPA